MKEERPPRRGSGDTSSSSSSSSSSSGERDKEEKAGDIRQLWGIFIFAVIGATATTYAVGQLRRTADWIYTQAPRPESSYKGGKAHRSFRTSFQEESWKRYNRRIQEEYEQEMERVERIRRMQSAFNREKNKYKRGYERSENSYTYHQQFEREDWYWKANPSFQYRRTPFGDTPRDNAPRSLSHHYAVLGLDRLRTRPYTDDEIKTAFRVKAKQFHPDQNQDNKEVAEARFKEIMASYDAIKTERKDNKL